MLSTGTESTSNAIPPPACPEPTFVNVYSPKKLSSFRRYVVLIIFCLAQFMDAAQNCTLFSAIPSLVKAFGITESESTWIISAFQLTFAAFLLISGRISDIYNPKYAFIGGFAVLGIFSLGCGFVKDKISLIVLRALGGIAAAMTIPSALTLLVAIFPEPTEQARAIGVFGGCGAIGNVSGLVVGAIFVQFADWRWVFWFVAMVAIPVAAISTVLIPPHERPQEMASTGYAKWRSLDLGGISILTAALILFIFALTSGSTDGWASAGVLAPLIISVFMVVGFFYYETRIPPSIAAVPPRTWFLPNFTVLFCVALVPFLWWIACFTIFTTLWQNIYQWSAISTALRMVPMGALALAMSFTGSLSRMTSPKYVLLPSHALVIISIILLHFADGPDTYYKFALPAFILGSAGSMLTYTHANIAIFRTSPASMAGTVGAIFNCALQLGSAVGLAAISSIETSVEKTHGGPTSYAGRAAAFWFLLAIVCLEFISVAIFYRVDAEKKGVDESGVESTAYHDKGPERLSECLSVEKTDTERQGCSSCPV